MRIAPGTLHYPHVLKRLRPYTRYLRPVRWQFVGALLAGLIYGLASGAGIPVIIKEVLPRIWVEGEQPVPLGDLLVIAAVLIAGMGLRSVSQFANMYGMAYCGQRVLEALRTDAFAHLQKLSLSFFQRRRTCKPLGLFLRASLQLGPEAGAFKGKWAHPKGRSKRKILPGPGLLAGTFCNQEDADAVF